MGEAKLGAAAFDKIFKLISIFQMKKFTSPFKKLFAGIILVFGVSVGTVAFAQINATSATTGYTDALNFTATVAVDPQFIGNGKLYFVMVHGSQLYFLSQTRGFVVYSGGEISEYKTISQSTETISISNWNTRGQLGAAIFVGYGADFFEMLNSGRFKQISTLRNVSPSGNPYARFNGLYTCYDEYYSASKVIATFTSNNAILDTSKIYTIPDYSINLPYTKIENNGYRQYDNFANILSSVKVILLDTSYTSDPLFSFAYGSSIYSSPKVFICKKD